MNKQKHSALLKTLLGLRSDATDVEIDRKHEEYKTYTNNIVINLNTPHYAEISRFSHMGVTKMIQSYASLLNRNVDKDFLADGKREYTHCIWETEKLKAENESLRLQLTSCRNLQREKYNAKELSDLYDLAKKEISKLKLQLRQGRRQTPNRMLLDIYAQERKVSGNDIIKYQHEVGQILGKKDTEIASLKEELKYRPAQDIVNQILGAKDMEIASLREQLKDQRVQDFKDPSENDDTKNLTRAKLVKNYTELVKDCGKHLPGAGDFIRRVRRIEAFGENEQSNVKTPFIRKIIKKGDPDKRKTYRTTYMQHTSHR